MLCRTLKVTTPREPQRMRYMYIKYTKKHFPCGSIWESVFVDKSRIIWRIFRRRAFVSG